MLDKECSLRYMKYDDLITVLKWRNSNHVRLNMKDDHIISPEEHRNWFNGLDTKKNHYLIFLYEGVPSGLVYFNNVNMTHKHCTWGFYLGNRQMPKGTGAKMGALGLEHAFEHLGVRKVCAEVFSFNVKSLRFHERLGFIKEGVLKEHYLKNNTYEDIVCYARFNKRSANS